MKIKDWIPAILFSAGVLLAGADGPWFPWINIAGIVVFGLVIAAVHTDRAVRDTLDKLP